MKYILMPFVAWLISGSCKFFVNYLCYGGRAKHLIGYGGFPSTHTTILSSVVFLCGFTDGFGTPVFSLGLGVLLILIIDAHDLRRKIGQQAIEINHLNKMFGGAEGTLRERMGHSWLEIGGGLFLGLLLAFGMRSI